LGTKRYNANDEVINYYEYLYDGNGRNFKNVSYYGDKDSINHTIHRVYDDNSYVVAFYRTTASGDTNYRQRTGYDSKFRRLYSAHDNDHSTYFYSDTQNIIHYVGFDDGGYRSTIYQEIDSRGLVVKEETDLDNNDTIDQVRKYFYNYKNLHIRSEMLSPITGEFYTYKAIKYNTNGYIKELINYEQNGNLSSYNIYEYQNHMECPSLSPTKIHKLQITIPEDGVWLFSTCGSAINTILALDSNSYCDSNMMYDNGSCIDGRAEFSAPLRPGKYLLTVGGKTAADTGLYNLNVTKLRSLSVAKTQLASFNFYPQPAGNQITFLDHNHNISKVEIVGITGSKIATVPYSKTIDLSPYGNGIYILRLWNDKKLIGTNKLIINK